MFELAGGTVAGRDHRDRGQNNHDALYFAQDEEMTIALVCDGCGAEPHSEVGSKLGVRLLAETLRRYVHEMKRTGNLPSENNPHAFPYWERVRHDVLASLRTLSNAMTYPVSDLRSGGYSQTVYSHFLFTVVGALITPWGSSFFSIGDGLIVVNGEEIVLGPFPNKQPPFLSYGLVETDMSTKEPELLRFQIHRVMATEEVDNFLVGTDGAIDLLGASSVTLPGKEKVIGPISQFWSEDMVFLNPETINRRLRLINTDSLKPDWESHDLMKELGRLRDDTTLVVGRRQEE